MSDFQPKSDNAETPTKDETEQDSAREYKTVRRYYELWLSSDFFISKPSLTFCLMCSLWQERAGVGPKDKTAGASRRGADKENCGRTAYPAILTPQGPYAPTCFIQCTRSNATIFVADVSAETGSKSPELHIPRLWDRGETPRINELGQMMKAEDNRRDFS